MQLRTVALLVAVVALAVVATQVEAKKDMMVEADYQNFVRSHAATPVAPLPRAWPAAMISRSLTSSARLTLLPLTF
jgi:hypothetical protein